MGRVLPLWKLGPRPRPDQELRPRAARAMAVEERQPAPGLGTGHQAGAAVTEPPGPDQPRWNRPPAQALPGLAGGNRKPPGKKVGKPGGGEPHTRFEGRGLG